MAKKKPPDVPPLKATRPETLDDYVQDLGDLKNSVACQVLVEYLEGFCEDTALTECIRDLAEASPFIPELSPGWVKPVGEREKSDGILLGRTLEFCFADDPEAIADRHPLACGPAWAIYLTPFGLEADAYPSYSVAFCCLNRHKLMVPIGKECLVEMVILAAFDLLRRTMIAALLGYRLVAETICGPVTITNGLAEDDGEAAA
jgi:hypothetical protein